MKDGSSLERVQSRATKFILQDYSSGYKKDLLPCLSYHLMFLTTYPSLLVPDLHLLGSSKPIIPVCQQIDISILTVSFVYGMQCPLVTSQSVYSPSNALLFITCGIIFWYTLTLIILAFFTTSVPVLHVPTLMLIILMTLHVSTIRYIYPYHSTPLFVLFNFWLHQHLVYVNQPTSVTNVISFSCLMFEVVKRINKNSNNYKVGSPRFGGDINLQSVIH